MFCVRDNFTRKLLAVFGSKRAAFTFARQQYYRGVICAVCYE